MTFLSVYIYLYIPSIVFISFVSIYRFNNKFSSIVGELFLFLLIIYVLCLRDIYAPADIYNYMLMYKHAQDFNDIFDVYHRNYFFALLMYIGNLLSLSSEIFFIFLSILYLLIYSLGLKLIFKNQKYYLLGLTLFVLSSTFVLLYTNVLRQGLAFSLLILALGLYLNKYKMLSYIVMLIAIFSHFSILPIILFIFISNYFAKIRIKYSFVIIIILFLPFLGTLLLDYLATFGGLFHKIISFKEHNYTNKLVYIKVFIIYSFSFLLILYGLKYDNFNDFNYRFLVNLYLLILSLILFTLPVLLLSSRFLYYASGFMPILITYIFYSQKNVIVLKHRYYLFLTVMVIYGFSIYNFPSVRLQLGI